MFKVVTKDPAPQVPEHQHRMPQDTNRCSVCGKTPEEIYQESAK